MSRGNAAIGGAAERDSSASGDVLHDLMRRGRSFSGHERHCCFLNLRQGRFADISSASGFDLPDDGRAVARVDWDHDGDLDLWIVNRNGPQVRLLRNEHPNDNHWLMMRLVGNGTTSNRDAIGARVTVLTRGAPADGRPLIATVRAGEGFLAQSTKWLHFGLGEADHIERVTIRWPDGQVQELSEVGIDRHWQVVQGEEQFQPWQPPDQRASALRPAPLVAPPSSHASRVRSAAFLPLPPIEYEAFTGEKRRVRGDGPRRPTAKLVNLWASWCQPCVSELADFAAAADRLQAADIEILALSVDGLDGEVASSGEAASALIERLNFPFAAGRASRETIEKLQETHDHLFDRHEPLAVPSSFLVDAEGVIAAVYRGPVDVDELLRDAKRLPLDFEVALEASVPFAGRWQGHRTHLNPYRLLTALVELGYLADCIEYLERYAELIPTPQKVAQLRFRFAEELLRKRERQAAEAQYRAGLKLDPKKTFAWKRLAALVQFDERYAEAIPLYQRALELADDDPEVHLNLGRAHYAEQHLDDALHHFRRADELRPDEPQIIGNLGATLETLGEVDEAIGQFRRLLEIDPTNELAHHNLARISSTRGDVDAAIRHLQQVVEAKPYDAQARVELGTALVQQKRVGEGIPHLRRAVSLEPDDVDTLNALAAALVMQGNLDEAQARLEQILELVPKDAAAHANLASIYTSQRKYEQAAWHRQRVAELQPESARAQFSLGTSLAQLGKTDEAIRHFRRAAKLQPDDGRALTSLAAALAKDGQLEEATTVLEQVVALEPDNAAAHASLGNVYLAGKQPRDAIRHLRRAVQLQPSFLNAHHQLAASLAAAGDMGAAIVHFREVVRLDPQNPAAHANLGIALLDEQETAEAIRYLQQAVKLDPNYAKARENLAFAFEQAGRSEEAEAERARLERLPRSGK